MIFTNIPGKQTLKVNLSLRFKFGGFYTVILSNDLIQNRNEYRDMLNLITYKKLETCFLYSMHSFLSWLNVKCARNVYCTE